MGTNHTVNKKVIFFDGVCNLCNSSVQFIIKRDSKNEFQFASLQSEFAKKNLPPNLTQSLQSILLMKDEKILDKSSAALSIAKHLSGIWPLLYVLMIIPKFIRDGIYNVIAKNRYRWFGKKDHCMIPSPELKSHFID